MSPCRFPTTVTITPRAFPIFYSFHEPEWDVVFAVSADSRVDVDGYRVGDGYSSDWE